MHYLQKTEKFHLLRKQIKLNWIEGQKFYLNHEYRERILSCITNPQSQLGLPIECFRSGSIDLRVGPFND